MNIRVHTFLRKATASLLLAILVFIYAEKVLHTHDKTASTTTQTGISVTAINTGCAICDFTVTREAELPQPAAINIPVAFIVKEFTVSFPSYYYLPETSLSDRGPPSF